VTSEDSKRDAAGTRRLEQAGALVLACGLAVLSLSCGHARAPLVVRRGPVLLIGSDWSCEGVRDERIARVVRDDLASFRAILLDERGPAIMDGDAATPDDVNAELGGASGSTRGQLVLYSGHGQGDGKDAFLCLAPSPQSSRRRMNANDLLGTASQPWAILLLNSCGSAQIDLRQARQGVSVISAAHGDAPAFSYDDHGTFLGSLIRRVLQGTNNEAEGPDQNCDGILTDYEVFTALTKLIETPQVATPNLRQQSQIQIPLPLDGTSSSPACRKAVRDRIEAIEARLLAQPDRPAHLLASALAQQRALADELGRDSALRRKSKLPDFQMQFYVTSPADDGVEDDAKDLSLTPFPGDVETARDVARFAIFTEVYLLSPEGDDVLVYRLREPHNMLRRVARSDLRSFLENLAQRALLTVREPPPEEAGAIAELSVRFVPQPDRNPVQLHFHLAAQERAAFPRLSPDRLILTLGESQPKPCEPLVDGQCFSWVIK
jgi:hypothetical protein